VRLHPHDVRAADRTTGPKRLRSEPLHHAGPEDDGELRRVGSLRLPAQLAVAALCRLRGLTGAERASELPEEREGVLPQGVVCVPALTRAPLTPCRRFRRAREAALAA